MIITVYNQRLPLAFIILPGAASKRRQATESSALAVLEWQLALALEVGIARDGWRMLSALLLVVRIVVN